MDIVIRNGTLITSDGVFAGDVGIVGEQIAVVSAEIGGVPEPSVERGVVELDATGCYVLPGGIDPHVHLQMPAGDYTSADDFASGTIAAALGGTTTVIDFVEPADDEPLLEALTSRRDEADGRVAVDYSLHMTIPSWHAARPEALETLSEVMSAGVPSFKLYLAYEGFYLDDASFYRVLEAIRAVGGLPIVHCENGPIVETLRRQAVARGDIDPIHHVLTRPPRQEAEAVSRAIDIAALLHSPIYILHVSCEESMSRIKAARERGEHVYSETCPQYLLLTKEALDLPGGERLVCSPPLRTQKDNEALWRGLVAEELDVLATDHCPFTAANKDGHADFTTIPGGLPSIEARLSLAHSAGQRHGMTLQRWVEVCSASPARIFGLSHKGHIAPGFDADLVIWDPIHSLTLEAGRTLHERVDWSPYEGLRCQGWPRDVLSRGRLVVRDGKFVGKMDWGRFVPREVS